MKKLISVIIACVILQGCASAMHFQNQKGVKVKGKDFNTKIGKIKKGKAHYWSEVDFWIWFPWKLSVSEKKPE